jgi:cyclopropane fatty-acyl-phospholipid synthase-like methyltransferase
MNTAAETMERIVPDLIDPHDKTAQLSLQLHIERYQFACRHLLPGKVLDIACGTGYGTRLLADWSDDVCTGVDISEEAIAYAQKRYAHERTRFICDSIMDFTSQGFSNIVSLETIEHMEDPGKVVAHLKSLLLPEGRLIVSAPVTPSMDANPYHVNDFTKRSFRKLFSDVGLVEVSSLLQKQPFSITEVSAKQGRAANARKGLLKYYLSHPGKFFLRLRSVVVDGFNNKYLVLVLRNQV